MKKIPLAALLMVSFVWVARGQGTAGNQERGEIENEILKIEQQRDQAVQKRDMAVLNRIQADDLSFVNTRGQVLTKAQYMDEIRSGTLKFLSFKQDDYRFHVYGDTVVMTGRSSGIVEYHGKANRIPRRFTIVYVREHGQWQLVAFHSTVIAEQ